MTKKRLAIVGYGGQGAWHATWAGKSDVVELAGIYDIAEKRVNAAKDNGIHTYASLEELVSDPTVDIVLCATPNDVHKDIVITALNAKKHVVLVIKKTSFWKTHLQNLLPLTKLLINKNVLKKLTKTLKAQK